MIFGDAVVVPIGAGKRALAGGQGHSGGIDGFSRALLWNPVDPGRAPARRARNLAVDRDGALDDHRSFLDVGLATAVEVLALLLGKEEASENFLARDGGRRQCQQACYEKK